MADERVVIKIDVKADTSAIDRVQRKLAALCAQASKCDDTFNGLSGDIDKTSESQKRLGRESDSTSSKLKKTGREAGALSKILKTGLKFAMIGSAIETAALAVALSSVNGLLATGRFLVKSYQVVMSGLAKAAAVAGIALATVAAAQKQYIAAQQAGRYGGFQGAAIALRTMSADARLAGLSMKSLNSAFAAASKNARVTGGTTSAIAGLMDFAAATGDIEKGVTSVATLVSLIQKGGVGGAGVAEAAKQLGPEFEKAFKEVSRGGKASAQEVLKAFSGGDMAKKAGIGGTFAAMQGTLIGQFKAFMQQMQTEASDLGARFITPVQVAFEKIRTIVIRTFTQISPLLSDFANGGLLGKVVNGIDKIAQFLVKLMREYVPATQNFFGKLKGFWDGLVSGFERFNAYLRGLSESSKIINRFFGKILKAIGGGLKKNFEQFAVQVQKNEGNLDKWGDSIVRLIDAIFELSRAFRDAFFAALPAITKIADALTLVLNIVSGIISGLSKLGPLGGLAGYMGLPLLMGGMGRMAKGGSFIGPGMKKMYGVATSPLGLTAIGALGTQALTNNRGSVVETGGDIATGAIIGYGATKAIGGAGGIPMLGAYAGPAALATAGAVGAYTAGNMVGSATYRATGGNRAATVGAAGATGAAVGAATGAGVGALLAAPTLGTSVIIGAIAGALIGGVAGWMQDGKFKKQAKKAAGQFVDNYVGVMEEALANNDVDSARQLLNDFGKEARNMANDQVKSGTALKEANKKFYEQNKNVIDSTTLMISRFKDLERISGLTTEEVQNLANTAEVDLGNSMLTLSDILAATGIATARFGDDFKYAMTDIYASATSSIRQTLELVQAPDIYAAAGRAFGEKGRANTVTDEDRAAFFEDIFQQSLLMAGGDPIQAYLNMQREYGTAARPGGQFSVMQGGKKGDLYGLADVFFGGGGAAMFGGAMGQLGAGAAGLTAENIIAEAAKLNLDIGMSKESLTAELIKMAQNDPTKFGQILQQTSQGGFLTMPGGYVGAGADFNKIVGDQLTNVLGPLGDKLNLQQTTSKTMSDAATGFKTAVNDVFAVAVDKFASAVGFFDDKGDTSTPRRNFVNMMNVHNRINGGIAGRRSITSGVRGFNLGSMNSDHAAGRAYDLVGQNLGLYQVGVRAGGGYAEFHGTGAQRHLHVVPGMDSAIGDTATPYMGGTISTPTATTNNNSINVTVNASQGMDVQALANEVMARIEAAQASWSERR